MKRASCWKVILVTAVLAIEMVVSQTTSESLPSITHHSGGRVVRPDESVTLNCDASDNVHLVQWYKNGGLVSSEPVYTIESFDATSAGNYSCKATVNDVGSITSAVVRLELASLSTNLPGESIDNPEIKHVHINSPASLSCGSVNSTPPAVYEWPETDIFLSQVYERYPIIKGIDGRLYFQLVTQEFLNLGVTFVCRVSNNDLGNFRQGFIQLAVNNTAGQSTSGSRVLQAGPTDAVVIVGESVSFQCIVGGSSLPTTNEVNWSTPETGNAFVSPNKITAVVRSATIADEGVYSCNVTGLGVFSATLTVLVPPTISTNLLTLYSPTFGDPLTMTCGSTNTLISEWVWFHDGDQLPMATTNTLTIDSTHTSDSGFYQCFAYNSAGNASSTTRVNVNVIPATVTDPSLSAPRLLFEGESITYTCNASGAPPPMIRWFHDGTPLGSDVATTVAGGVRERNVTSVLELSSLSIADSGRYKCQATNVIDGMAVGSAESEAVLQVIVPTVITKPSQAEDLRVLEEKTQDTIPCIATAQDGVDLTFSWFKNNAPLVYNGTRLHLVTDSHSANITYNTVEREDGGFYRCSVVSVYQGIEGHTVTSTQLTVETTEIPEIPPKIQDPENITSSSFKIIWYYPGQRALDKLTSYTVSYKEDGDSEPIRSMEVPANGDNYLLISSSPTYPVQPFTTYNVTVAANYKTDAVEEDSVLVTTLEDRPGPPSEVIGVIINTTIVLLEWKHPAEPNGIITNYTVRYKKDTSPSSSSPSSSSSSSGYQTIGLSTNSTHLYLTHLDQSSAYLMGVAASTSVGLGPYSDSISLSLFLPGSESSSTQFYRQPWFIAVMLITFVVLLVAGMLVAFAICFCARSNKKKKYNVHTGMELDHRNGTTRSLTEDDMKDYNGRSSRMNGESSSIGLLLDGRESESSRGSSRYQYEPSISTMSHVSSQAPAYINPPPFHEAIKSLRPAQISPAYSGSTLDQHSTVYTAETDSSFWPDSNSKTRILNVDQSPSPARSYQHSPYTSSTPPIPAAHRPDNSNVPPPPPPPPPPPLPKSPDHKYASVNELGYKTTSFDRQEEEERVGGEGNHSHHNSPGPAGYDANRYNRLPLRPSSQQRVRLTSTPQRGGNISPPDPPLFSLSPTGHRIASSSPPLHILSSSPLHNQRSATIGSGSSRIAASSFQLQSGSHTTSSTGQSNPLFLRSSVQNMRMNSTSSAAGTGTRPGPSSPHVRTNSQPALAKTSSQPNFATFV